MVDDALKALRENVRKRRANVSAKIRRIEKNTGVDIAGHKEDPRRSPSVINKYNRNQLVSYYNELDSFMNRSAGVGDPNADALRAAISKRRSSVTRKIRRIYNTSGAELTGHIDDPRRPPEVLAKYNKRQLAAYHKQLDAFMSRSVRYVAGSGGVPIAKQKWDEYKRLERKYNKIGDAKFEKMADIFLPTEGMTVRQREAMIKAPIPRAAGQYNKHPYMHMDKNSKGVVSEKALNKLIKDMQRRLKGGYNESVIKKQREELDTALDRTGMDQYKDRAKKLSNQQFDILWNYAKLATRVYDLYNIMKMMSGRSSDSRWYDSVVEDSSNELGELFSWAESIQPENIVKGSATNTQKRNSQARNKKDR